MRCNTGTQIATTALPAIHAFARWSTQRPSHLPKKRPPAHVQTHPQRNRPRLLRHSLLQRTTSFPPASTSPVSSSTCTLPQPPASPSPGLWFPDNPYTCAPLALLPVLLPSRTVLRPGLGDPSSGHWGPPSGIALHPGMEGCLTTSLFCRWWEKRRYGRGVRWIWCGWGSTTSCWRKSSDGWRQPRASCRDVPRIILPRGYFAAETGAAHAVKRVSFSI